MLEHELRGVVRGRHGGFDGGASSDGGDAGDDAGTAGPPLCGTGVTTDSPDCDRCTEAFCCAAWTGCFDDQDCSDLDDCLASCPTE